MHKSETDLCQGSIGITQGEFQCQAAEYGITK